MKKLALSLAGSVLIIGLAVSGLSAHQIRGPMTQPSPNAEGQFGPSWMGYGAMMGPGMMMGGGMMGYGGMPSMMIAMMDTNGDGALSLDEFEAIHSRVFNAMDANKDGKLSPEEMEQFMHGDE
jgi:hypothetical protein